MKKNALLFLIEDDQMLSRIISWEISEKYACKVQVFDSGEAALEALHENPDIVILDYFLPGLLGSDVLKKIKQQCPDAKIIAVSGAYQMQEVRDFFEMGVEVAIEKDTDFLKKVREKVGQLLDQSNAPDQLIAIEVKNKMDKE